MKDTKRALSPICTQYELIEQFVKLGYSLLVQLHGYKMQEKIMRIQRKIQDNKFLLAKLKHEWNDR